MMTRVRKVMCAFRLDPADVALLGALAERRGTTKTDVLRDAVHLLAEAERVDP
jgi:hypothetical protein